MILFECIVSLDRPREVILVITTGRNDIVKVSAHMIASLDGVDFDFSNATVAEGGQ